VQRLVEKAAKQYKVSEMRKNRLIARREPK
jgi:hypothetical protein